MIDARGRREGIGYDLHRLAVRPANSFLANRSPFHKGPVGHSDGRPRWHPLLRRAAWRRGAAGLGDLGHKFPGHDRNGKTSFFFFRACDSRARSRTFAEKRALQISHTGGGGNHRKNRRGPHFPALLLCGKRWRPSLGISTPRFNLKAKTTKGVGPRWPMATRLPRRPSSYSKAEGRWYTAPT